MYGEVCQHLGWVDPPSLEKCVPTKEGHKKTDNSTDHTTPTTPIQAFKVRTGYKIPKTAISTHIGKEEGEVNSSDDDMPQPTVASKICRPRRTSSESPAAELRRAIELLEEADELEQKAMMLRKKAKAIRHRYDKSKRNGAPS